jgi:hypothetical protein
MCIKELRLVTIQLPENFSPIGVGTNRISHIRVSAKFNLKDITESPGVPCPFREPVCL